MCVCMCVIQKKDIWLDLYNKINPKKNMDVCVYRCYVWSNRLVVSRIFFCYSNLIGMCGKRFV